MPAYHSQYNDTQAQIVCGCAMLPIRTKVKGNAPLLPSDQKEDIIDEAIKLFKANVLFRNYEIKGPADRVLIYLTFFIHQCLLRLEKKKIEKKDEADKLMFQLAQEKFDSPGDKSFLLGGYYPAPQSKAESGTFFFSSSNILVTQMPGPLTSSKSEKSFLSD
jgi:actin related protein 2/3 complex subunit 3